MTKKFLLKYFPPAKTTKLRNNISSFAQFELETLMCSHHGLPLWLQIIDATTDETLNNKTPEAAQEFIKQMALNNYQWQVMRTKPTKAAGVFNIDTIAMLASQVNSVMELRCDWSEESSKFLRWSMRIIQNSLGVVKEIRGHNPLWVFSNLISKKKKSNLEELLTKFISVSESRFQNTKMTLINQQTSI
ncbi:Retrotransposon gag protein [Gossypium australe]|uniref:Retrotransposon gag protein n=1 Tax=Gossypium australe TaxID=47621 RepID=A0A5B6V0Q8_9ROSI|nr:Retrotransposon gag protein [Gossypium australe]